MDFQAGSTNLNAIVNAVQKVSRVLFRDFGEIQLLQNSHNGVEHFAAKSREKVEYGLVKDLLLSRPKYGYTTSSEKVKGEDISHTFIIDALCGFDNFTRGIPHFCISVALQEQNSIIAAVIYNPILDFMYYAEKGDGAFFHEARSSRRVRIGNHSDIKGSFLAFSSTDERVENSLKGNQISKVVSHLAMKARDAGCPALDLAFTADNKYDAFVGYNESLFSMAAALLVFKEAGGNLTSYKTDGSKDGEALFYSDCLVASNEKLGKKISEFLFGE